MDLLEFIQKGEAPAIFGASIWYFRDPVKQLIIRLKSAKFLGVEVDLDDKIAQITIPAEIKKISDDVRKPIAADLEQALEITPRQTILQFWDRVEQNLNALRELCDPNNPIDKIYPPPSPLSIAQRVGLDGNIVEYLAELWTIRELLQNDPSVNISQDGAKDYRFKALFAIGYLSSFVENRVLANKRK